MQEEGTHSLPPSLQGSAADIAVLSAAAYEDLRKMAKARLRASGPLTLLDTSGLVSDTYRRLAQQKDLQIGSRALFLGYCSRIMRSIIIDLVRERRAERRGGDAQKITLSTDIDGGATDKDDPLRIDDALADLSKVEPRLAQVVEMRYFGGYSETEIAEALDVTVRTIQRDWQKARILLLAMLTDAG